MKPGAVGAHRNSIYPVESRCGRLRRRIVNALSWFAANQLEV